MTIQMYSPAAENVLGWPWYRKSTQEENSNYAKISLHLDGDLIGDNSPFFHLQFMKNI